MELERIVPRLLGQLVGGRLNPTQHLERQQALVKQLAEILEFVLKFDEYKVSCVAIFGVELIRNHFLHRWRHPQYKMTSAIIGERFRVNAWITTINRSSAQNWQIVCRCFTPTRRQCWRFSARPRQSLFKIMRTTSITQPRRLEPWRKFVSECWRKSEWSKVFNLVPSSFFLKLWHFRKLLSQIEREETHLLVLRVMVGLVILYDHVHPDGAFVRTSHVDVKGCVKLLQAQPAIKAEPLLNALRYTTKHLNEEATPKNIRNLLAS